MESVLPGMRLVAADNYVGHRGVMKWTRESAVLVPVVRAYLLRLTVSTSDHSISSKHATVLKTQSEVKLQIKVDWPTSKQGQGLESPYFA